MEQGVVSRGEGAFPKALHEHRAVELPQGSTHSLSHDLVPVPLYTMAAKMSQYPQQTRTTFSLVANKQSASSTFPALEDPEDPSHMPYPIFLPKRKGTGPFPITPLAHSSLPLQGPAPIPAPHSPFQGTAPEEPRDARGSQAHRTNSG